MERKEVTIDKVFGTMASHNSDIKAVPAEQIIIGVTFSLDTVFEGYVQSMLWKLDSDEIYKGRLQEKVQLTEEEITYYFGYILQQRIRRCNHQKVNFSFLNDLWVPTFFATAIAMIGRHDETARGFTFVPKCDDEVKYDESRILEISQKFFRLNPVLQLVHGAAPRDINGDPEVMTMACINDHVRGMTSADHPLMTYLSAFLNARIVEEVAFSGLYNVQYDSLARIRHVFETEGESLC